MKRFILFIFILSTHNVFAHDKLDSFDLYQKIEQSTVRINIWEDYEKESGVAITGGTGVVINEIDGTYYILTNSHVILDTFCFNDYQDGCIDKEWDDRYSIVIDHPNFEYEYLIEYSQIMYWFEYDIGVIAIDLSDEPDSFIPIEIGGAWHPLMKIYGAGYPSILGNYYKNYADMVFCSGVVNTLFSDEEALSQLANYAIAHSCTLAGGMSGGPLVDGYGLLLGINGLTGVSELRRDQTGEIADLDIAPANFNYAVDIWDIYRLEIEDDEGHFNSESLFYNYLPKLTYYYHYDFYESYIELYPDKIEKIKLLFE